MSSRKKTQQGMLDSLTDRLQNVQSIVLPEYQSFIDSVRNEHAARGYALNAKTANERLKSLKRDERKGLYVADKIATVEDTVQKWEGLAAMCMGACVISPVKIKQAIQKLYDGAVKASEVSGLKETASDIARYAKETDDALELDSFDKRRYNIIVSALELFALYELPKELPKAHTITMNNGSTHSYAV